MGIGIISMFLFCLISMAGHLTAQIRVVSVRGNVYVRHGVEEKWGRIAAGDMLKPDDSIKLPENSGATLSVNEKSTLKIPERVILDLADLRQLTREELLLKLAMEQVRSVPARERGGFAVPRTTTVHGSDRGTVPIAKPGNLDDGLMRLGGARFLYTGKFFATCILKVKEIFRVWPELSGKSEDRIMVARAMENMNLKGEALAEYMRLAGERNMPDQEKELERKIEQLKKQANGVR
jgi:hypothetical protein